MDLQGHRGPVPAAVQAQPAAQGLGQGLRERGQQGAGVGLGQVGGDQRGQAAGARAVRGQRDAGRLRAAQGAGRLGVGGGQGRDGARGGGAEDPARLRRRLAGGGEQDPYRFAARVDQGEPSEAPRAPAVSGSGVLPSVRRAWTTVQGAPSSARSGATSCGEAPSSIRTSAAERPAASAPWCGAVSRASRTAAIPATVWSPGPRPRVARARVSPWPPPSA